MNREPIAIRSVSVSVGAGLRAGVLPSVLPALLAALFPLIAPQNAAADPSRAAVAEFNIYIAQLESRLARQHGSAEGLLAPFDASRVRGWEVIIEQITLASGATFPGAMLHHW